MSKEVLLRLGISDIVVSQETNENMSGYARIYDNEGNLVTETEIYFIGYEDEDGNECNGDGEEL
jgi:hypothetical protein